MSHTAPTTLKTLIKNIDITEEEWSFCSRKNVTVDGKIATLIRYTKTYHQPLYEEHFSSLFNQDGQLLGFVLMDTANNSGLINETNARYSCDRFLKLFAPDLLKNREILWIRPHHETLIIHNQKIIIRGMKVKSINHKTGLFFWTIIDGNGKVFVFERDIQWLDLKGKRGTEMWLHDKWLDETNAKNSELN